MRAQPQLAQMIKGQMFDGCLLVRASQQRTAQSGSKYLDMTLCDISAEVNAKMWDSAALPPEAGKPIRLRGMLQEYNGRAQLRVDKIRPVEDKDEVDLSLLIPVAPVPSNDMLGQLTARIAAVKSDELRTLLEKRIADCGKKLEYYPAATKLHHAQRGGLLYHTTTMLRAAEALCDIYPTLDRDLLAAGVILHDLCKITEIDSDEMGVATDYTRQGMLIGHLVQGVAEIDRIGREIHMTPELLEMVEHMVLAHHELPEYGSPKPPMFPEAEVLHTLDELDARMFEMNQALAQVNPGEFTERLWSLDRRLYRRSEGPEAAQN